ncbi:hypothetical protein ASPZODRAFT_1236947 [Penicilliopsis zonata CBS 506.65]|uniref:Sulfhydryl oxidase n=1 Tax=Penicilliopsis zonata CBS 506.65 TaxID=1073090 RepID=A0A1L9S6X5_9EURO|nr:hypothetical protein ASPZODRAFT_1236947 [Penicilliopsis zonata CBS 506.65]OJJ42909.1 hypothetical protein ASPZODRAFT_1236947 [Penicilliopsis zonata CBS 506.65]
MANRQLTRRIFAAGAIAIFLLFILFIQPNGPPSPAVRAPGHIDKSAPSLVKEDMLKGEVVMPKLGNETAKAELGRSTWKFLHTMMARYPEEPTEEQQETLRSFIYLFSRLYPCGECVSSRNAAAGWACFIHNEVNTMLKKPLFDCNNIGDFYDCGCGDEGAKKGDLLAKSSTLEEETPLKADISSDVEISKEATTRG